MMTKQHSRQGVLPRVTPDQTAHIEQQIIEKQRAIDYDTKEFTVELLVQKFESSDPVGEKFYLAQNPQQLSILIGTI
jgi:hypothetical protein